MFILLQSFRFHKQSSSRDGYTLVEVMLVVVLIGLLAAIAIPAFHAVRSSAQATSYRGDLRVFSEAFQLHSMENGSWPPSSAGGTMPDGMAGFLPASWTQETRSGGHWVWESGDAGIRASIIIESEKLPIEVAEKIDSKIDDGSLGSGVFLSAGAGRYRYIIEQD